MLIDTHIVTNIVLKNDSVEPILDINKFSSLHKLHRVTAYVFQFIFKTKKQNKDFHLRSKEYWLKIMQNIDFEKEIAFLKSTSDKVPELVKRLNLFLDDNGFFKNQR